MSPSYLQMPSPSPSTDISTPPFTNSSASLDRINIRLAQFRVREQQLLKSWFPTSIHPKGGKSTFQVGDDRKTEPADEDNAFDENNTFTVDPELYVLSFSFYSLLRQVHSCAMVIHNPRIHRIGLGATLSDARKANDEQAHANERLKRQIMGADWKKKAERSRDKAGDEGDESGKKHGIKPRPRQDDAKRRLGEDEDGEEDEGRSTMLVGRKKGTRQSTPRSEGETAGVEVKSTSRRKQRSSYMDEVLSARDHKKRKKSRI